jgi:hypothetical protein
MKVRIIISWTLLLIIIDQTIKIIINNFLLESKFEIIPSLLEFKATFNNKYSYVNTLLYDNFHVNIGLLSHIVLYLILEVIVLNIYISFKIKLNNNYTKILDSAIIFQISSMLCALIGNLFWKEGILDYIYLKPLFIFDLKDIYNSIFTCLFLVYVLKNKGQLKNFKLLNQKELIVCVKKYFRK